MSIDFSLMETQPTEIFSRNATHNLNKMWKKAGIYDEVYNSEGKEAYKVVKALKVGLQKMVENPEEYQELAPSNGWGTYEGALSFLNDIIEACENNPNAEISISK